MRDVTIKIQKYTLIILLSIILKMRNVSDKSFRENYKKTHFMISKTLFSNEIIWKIYFRGWQATEYNMVHAHCVLDT